MEQGPTSNLTIPRKNAGQGEIVFHKQSCVLITTSVSVCSATKANTVVVVVVRGGVIRPKKGKQFSNYIRNRGLTA